MRALITLGLLLALVPGKCDSECQVPQAGSPGPIVPCTGAECGTCDVTGCTCAPGHGS